MPKLGPHVKHAQRQEVSTNENCKSCQSGKYQSQTGVPNVQCKFCTVGKEFIDKSTACGACLAGKYQLQQGLQGYLVYFARPDLPIQLQRLPVLNAPGKYQNENNVASASCQTCSKGQYSSGHKISCTICPTGKYQEKDEAPSTRAKCVHKARNSCQNCLSVQHARVANINIKTLRPLLYVPSAARENSSPRWMKSAVRALLESTSMKVRVPMHNAMFARQDINMFQR